MTVKCFVAYRGFYVSTAHFPMLCYLGKRHTGTLVIIYPLLCNISLNIRVKQRALIAYAGLAVKL